MSVLDLTIDARALDVFLLRLESFPDALFMRGLAQRVVGQTDRRFESKTSPEGARWKPWSEAYRKQGAPFHSQHTLLQLSGDMQGSIQPTFVGDDKAVVEAVGIPYAGRQNADRQFMGFVDEDPELGDYAIGYLVGSGSA